MIGNIIAAATPVQRVVAVAMGAVVLAAIGVGLRNLGKEEDLTLQTDAFHPASRPLIDVGAPVQTATATFALG